MLMKSKTNCIIFTKYKRNTTGILIQYFSPQFTELNEALITHTRRTESTGYRSDGQDMHQSKAEKPSLI
jgi:hypothetical protein